jgi:hypothetical protein
MLGGALRANAAKAAGEPRQRLRYAMLASRATRGGAAHLSEWSAERVQALQP